MQGGEHQVACLRCFHGNFCRLFISNLSHHDDVRILPKDRAQAPCKRQASFGIDVGLVNAGEDVLNRVLNRDDIDRWLAQFVKRTVESRALAGARWAGHQEHALWQR